MFWFLNNFSRLRHIFTALKHVNSKRSRTKYYKSLQNEKLPNLQAEIIQYIFNNILDYIITDTYIHAKLP